MNQRLDLTAIATYLRSQSGLAGVHVGTGYDRDYLTAFATTWPGVWVGAQRLQRNDDGRGYTDYYRQHCRVEIVVHLVVQRYADGETDPGPDLDALHEAVSTALLNYRPTGADEPFVWESSQDGEAFQSVMTADLVFSCTVTYASTP